jgi:C-terminal processing protease CtpA/Prc
MAELTWAVTVSKLVMLWGAKLRVVSGDKIVSVDGNLVSTYEALEAILGAIGRPVIFKIERSTPAQVRGTGHWHGR